MATEQHSKQKSDMCYVGIASCGRVVVIVVDSPEHKKDVARSVAGIIRRGYAARRMLIDECLKIGLCKCPRNAKGKLQHVAAEVSA